MTDIARAGWLLRQSSFLKRWKREWFSLTVDGYLRHFQDPNKLMAEDTLHIPSDALKIIVGIDVKHKAPANYENNFLIEIVTRKKGSWILCAADIDEMLAWQIALEQARCMNRQEFRHPYEQMPPYLREVLTYSNGRYPVYYRGSYRGTYPSRIVNTPNGPITVVYVDQPYGNGYYNSGNSVLAGAAVASCLLWPFWFPIFWC